MVKISSDKFLEAYDWLEKLDLKYNKDHTWTQADDQSSLGGYGFVFIFTDPKVETMFRMKFL